MPGPSMWAWGCVWRCRKGGGHKFVPCHAQSIPFYTHTTKLTTVTANKMLERSSSWVNRRNAHTNSHAPVILYTDWQLFSVWFTPLVLHPRKFDKRHQTSGDSPSFCWDVNSWGLLCYDSHCHIWCVCVCVFMGVCLMNPATSGRQSSCPSPHTSGQRAADT